MVLLRLELYISNFTLMSQRELQNFTDASSGWKIEKWDGMDYWMVTTGPDSEPGINGGIVKRMNQGTTYNVIGVPSVDEIRKETRECGRNCSHGKESHSRRWLVCLLPGCGRKCLWNHGIRPIGQVKTRRAREKRLAFILNRCSSLIFGQKEKLSLVFIASVRGELKPAPLSWLCTQLGLFPISKSSGPLLPSHLRKHPFRPGT